MNSPKLEYPGAWLAPLGTDAEKFATGTKLAAAMKLYESGRFSGREAAKCAPITSGAIIGMACCSFIVPFRQTPLAFNIIGMAAGKCILIRIANSP